MFAPLYAPDYCVNDYHYELVAMMMNINHLEAVYGVGLHTISVPHIPKTEDIELEGVSY